MVLLILKFDTMPSIHVIWLKTTNKEGRYLGTELTFDSKLFTYLPATDLDSLQVFGLRAR